jgi:hypothetical protein
MVIHFFKDDKGHISDWHMSSNKVLFLSIKILERLNTLSKHQSLERLNGWCEKSISGCNFLLHSYMWIIIYIIPMFICKYGSFGN